MIPGEKPTFSTIFEQLTALELVHADPSANNSSFTFIGVEVESQLSSRSVYGKNHTLICNSISLFCISEFLTFLKLNKNLLHLSFLARWFSCCSSSSCCNQQHRTGVYR